MERGAIVTHDKNVDLPHPSSPNNRIVDVVLSSWVPCESAIAIESIKVLLRVVWLKRNGSWTVFDGQDEVKGLIR